MITADQLLAALPPAESETVEVDLDGIGVVTVRALSLLEHRDMSAQCTAAGEFDNHLWTVLLLEHGVADPKLDHAQAAELANRRCYTVQKLTDAILDASGLTETGKIDKKAVDDAEASFQQE